MAYESPLTIAEVIKDISKNKYVLPSIQREFVWSTSQIERLFDSLMQGYPIGTFLFWVITKEHYSDYDFYRFLDHYHEKIARHNTKANLSGEDHIMAVLDGQQRMTSLYIGLKGNYAYKLPYKQWKNNDAFPKRKLYLNLITPCDDGNNKYTFSFLADYEVKNDSKTYWYEVGKILDMTSIGDVTKFLMKEIIFTGVYSQEQCEYAQDVLSQLFNVIHIQPSISYYKEKSAELDKVLNIFIRVNSGGTILSYSDLLLSIATAQWENHDAREEITELVNEINSIGNGFNVNKDFVLKSALVLSDFKNIAFKVDNFNKPNMLKIEANWDTIQKSLKSAFNLVSSFGYSRDTLKSNNAIIPIAYYLMTIGLPDNFEVSTSSMSNREKIKKWLIRSLLKKAFSGQPDNVLRPIREIIRNNGYEDFPLNQIIEHFKGTNKSIVFTDDDVEEYLLNLKYGSSETLSTLMLLYPSLDFNNKFHVDHMYPKSKFTKKYLMQKGITADKVQQYLDTVNNIENLQLLAAIPNIEKQNKDFDVWFSETHPTDESKRQYRNIHYIPEMSYTYNNFMVFANKRRDLLKTVLKKELL